MISSLIGFINKQQFQPGFWGVFVNPFFISRKNLLKAMKHFSQRLHGKTLDIGCGTKPYQQYFTNTEYIGLEIEIQTNRQEKKADFYYDGKTFPFPDGTFDSALSNQVLEHVFTPNDFLKEVNRVMKREGILLLSVPFVWDEHEQPYDYARYSSFGLEHILKQNGFEILEQKKLGTPVETIFQLINAYLYKVTKKIPIIKQTTTFFIMSFFTIAGLIASKILPANEDLYLDNIILLKKVRNV